VVLEGLGWRLHRVWSTDWWINPEREVQKILARLNAELERQADDAPEAEAEVDAEAQAEAQTEAGMSQDAVPASAPGAGAGRGVPFEITTEEGAWTAENGASASSGLSGSLPVYTLASLDGGDAEAFYSRANNSQVAEQLRVVIETEGPVAETVLHRRVARAWGLERTGVRIVERLRTLTPMDVGQTEEGDATFYWPGGVKPEEWKGFRSAGDDDATRRRIDDVCVQELANGVLHVLAMAGNAPKADVIKSVCRMLGMARTLADAEARVGMAVSRLVQQGLVREEMGMLRTG
jgi:hypothetical protein